MKSIAIRIYGRVQGVGFRYHTQQVAREHNISGMVKNMIDGSVYIEASGTEQDINQFVGWCHKGPRWAYIEQVEVNDIADRGYSGFTISG
jgi:acylphosphatase